MTGQEVPPSTEAERTEQGQVVSPADAAVLKDIGLTSGEESSGHAWGSSGDEDTPHLDAAQELDSKDVSSGETSSPLRTAAFFLYKSQIPFMRGIDHPLVEAAQQSSSTSLSLDVSIG